MSVNQKLRQRDKCAARREIATQLGEVKEVFIESRFSEFAFKTDRFNSIINGYDPDSHGAFQTVHEFNVALGTLWRAPTLDEEAVISLVRFSIQEQAYMREELIVWENHLMDIDYGDYVDEYYPVNH